MKAVLMNGVGEASVLHLGEAADPVICERDVLVKVRATAVNRADLLQRRGAYPPPKGESPLLGLELAGEVKYVGPGVTQWTRGDRVMALLPGGGYAEYAAVPEGMLMRVPEKLTVEQAAAIPEVFFTAYLNLFRLAGLAANQTVLVHAGASGVGTAAVQLIREAGATSFVTAGSSEKLNRCVLLGASGGWNYKQGPFAPWVLERTGGRGVDIILDFVGAPYLEQNLQSLAVDGRMVVIGTMGGNQVQGLDLGQLLRRRLQIIGTALRSRSPEYKVALTAEFAAFALPRFADGRLKPVVDKVFPWQDVAAAHEYMESNRNIGKIVLRMDD